MSETLYNRDYYPSLLQAIRHTLKEEGKVIIGTKTFYYGLGGGFYEFHQFLRATEYLLEEVERLNDSKSIERMILKMRKRGPEEPETMGGESVEFLSFA